MKKITRISIALLTMSALFCLLFSTAVFAKLYHGNDEYGYQWTFDDTTGTIRYDIGTYAGEATDIYAIFSQIKHLVIADEINDWRQFNYFADLETVTLGKNTEFHWNEAYGTRVHNPHSAKEYIVDKNNPYLETYEGAIYSENFEILYSAPEKRTNLIIHPKCKIFASYGSVAESYEVNADHPYFATYDGALYNKDYTKLIIAPRNRETIKLHTNVKEVDILQRPTLKYEIDAKNKYFSIYDDMLYSKDYKTLFACPSEKKQFKFHQDLKVVETNAFRDMTFENPVVFPVGTTTLRKGAINSCESFVNGPVVIPDTLVNAESARDEDAISGRCTVIYSKRNTAFTDYPVSDQEFNQYYTKTSGKWQTLEGSTYKDTYYILENGRRASGWTNIGKEWYYFDPTTNILQKGFQYIDGKAYFLGTTGAREHDKWKSQDGKWYYLNSWGAGVVNCWRLSGGKWYYLQRDGSMAVNKWIKHYQKWYYVGKDGAMYVNRKTPDGNYVNGSGVWVS